MDSPVGMLVFFALFEVLGGGALGIALRGILRKDFSGIFFLIWGAGFGGIPLIIGAANFLAEGQITFFYAQLFLFFAPMLTVALLPPDFMQGDTFGGSEAGAVVGAVFVMVGGAVTLLNLRGGISVGLVLGGIFALLGIWLVLRSAVRILQAP